MSKLTKQDQELIDAATKAIKSRYRNDWQEVGAAMRTRDGRLITGVNLDAYVGRGAVCAEAEGTATAAQSAVPARISRSFIGSPQTFAS